MVEHCRHGHGRGISSVGVALVRKVASRAVILRVVVLWCALVRDVVV